MSKLSLVRDEKFQQHLTPDLHPESPKRVAAIDQALHESALAGNVEQLSPRAATLDEICLVHSAAYVETLEENSEKTKKGRFVQLDADTFMSPNTLDIARLAAGAGLVALDSVKGDAFQSSFVAVRPPGHHASRAKPMGFCLFNNVALAARYAQKELGLQRIFIIDWDVHHGNGTQDIFYDDPSVHFVSFHQYPFWPGTGWYDEDGGGEGRGYNMNIPLPEATGDRGYLYAWDQLVKPVCQEFNPDLILLSAGYDAHQMDPLGQQRISTSGYAMLSQRLVDLSQVTGAKVVAFLEGGYNVKSLSDSAIATMKVLNADGAEEVADVHVSYLVPGSAAGADPITADRRAHEVDERVADVKKHFSKYWKSLQ
ncbi:MAG TPA: histone deacetylase [Planktothrix sp.]|jgi:acetoin utilization deacetylase AcuC-like enzyme